MNIIHKNMNQNNILIKKEAVMLIEDIKEKDLWKYFCVSGSLIAIHEIVKRHNKEREQNREKL